MEKNDKRETRRQFLKKGAYAAPVILTLSATPSFAGQGSGRNRKYGGGGSSSSSDDWHDGGSSSSSSDSGGGGRWHRGGSSSSSSD